ncbi:uncharacterized protein LOC142518145 [Primulina tabacum]|uniref:uncharacterized protein LOC142518145 n=1 Tax=Primulina tabacum TaxID=48773 RepID=UPI003F599400
MRELSQHYNEIDHLFLYLRSNEFLFSQIFASLPPLTLLSSLHFTHARDNQFFNTVTNNNVLPHEEQPLNNQQQQEPDFHPENDNGYRQESNNYLHPSSDATTFPDGIESKQPLNKYRPKNYNPVAYVTEPEDTGDAPSLTNYENSNNYPNNLQQQEEESEYRSYPTTTTVNNRNNYNNYYGGSSSFNSDPLGTIDTRFMGGAASEKYFNNGGETTRYQPQGMSDTRSLESGKYFYDVNSEKYSNNHPFTRLSGVRARNEYSDSENTHEFNGENSIGGYQNQDDFQDEEDNALP